MNDIIVVSDQDNKLEAAYRGLMGELSPLSQSMYSVAIRDFHQYALNVGRNAFGDNISVLFSDYMRYLRDCQMAPTSIQTRRSQLRRYFEWCARVGTITYIDLQQLKAVKSPKTQGAKAGTWLSEEQMQQLLNAPDTSTLIGRRDKAVLALLMGCALRRSEVVNLTWKHITRHDNRWVIKNLSRKHNRMQAYIPIPDWAKKVLDAYTDGGNPDEKVIVSIDQYGNQGKSLSVIGVYNIIKKYAAQLGFGDLTPHDLRRSWSRAAREHGVEVTQIQAALGHASVATTQRYIAETMNIRNIADAFSLETGNE